MGTLIDQSQHQNLNLYPDPTSAAAASDAPSTAATIVVPKLEPKLEPYDPHSEPVQSPHFSNPSHPISLNSESNAGTPNSSEESNVYSEFNRVSELFRTAFAQRMEKYGDVEALDPNSMAIVPVPEANQLSAVAVAPPSRQQQRSAELVRVMDLGEEDERYFRDNVRRTRMIYDALRILSVVEEEKRRGVTAGRRWSRGDLKASAVMKDRGLWLNRDKRIVGSVPGVLIGDVFFFRMELCVVGLHGQPQAGIDYVTSTQSSNGEPIATSIVASGGYEDDVDGGDVIIYTGHGGQDKHSRQCFHQKLEGGNLALERSMHYGIEVRVIRGFKFEGRAGGKVYVYDGLYRVIDSWFDVGRSGFGVYKFKLIRIDNQPELGSSILRFAENLRTRPLTLRPTGYVSFDISMNKEQVPVFLYNDIDDDKEPMYYEYIASAVCPPLVYHYEGYSSGCGCVSGCLNDCPCALRNGGEFAYDQNGMLVRGKPLIFECGTHCHCPPTCRNRVSQKGVKTRFEVFRSRETGWGVRTLDLIQAGAFICEYAGVVLTSEQAQVFTMNGDTLVYPHRFAKRWPEWGDLSKVFSDYVCPSYPSIPPLAFAMDVSRMRNVACYMSHSSTPNALVQLVLYDHNNVMYPHLMLFAMENIPPMRELSLDYGVADEGTRKLSLCN